MIPGKLDIQLYRAATHTITIDVDNSLGAPYEIVGTNQLRIYRNYNEAAILTVALTWNGTALVGMINTTASDIEAGSYPYHLWNVNGAVEQPVLRGMVQIADVFVGNFVDVDSSVVVDSVTYQVTVANIVSTSKIVTISDFGAKGDGSDETAILQAGIDASAGVYTLVIDKPVRATQQITLPSNTHIRGTDTGKILMDTGTPIDFFINDDTTAGNDNIVIESLKFDGSSVIAGAVGDASGIIRLFRVDGFVIKDCQFKNVPYHCLRIGQNTNFQITGNHFDRIGNLLLTDGTPPMPLGCAIIGDQNKFGVISNNNFDFCHFGFILLGGLGVAGGYTGHISIANNSMNWAQDNGIRIENDVSYLEGCRSISITGNTITDVRGPYIRAQGINHTITGNTITRATITNTAVGKNTPLGIWVGGTGHVVSANTIRDESVGAWMSNGILIFNHANYNNTHIIITNNVLFNMICGIKCDPLHGSVTGANENKNIQILGNQVYNVGTGHGINCINTTELVLTGNLVNTSAGSGIRVSACNAVNIVQNITILAFTASLRCETSDNVLIVKNIVKLSGANGIDIFNCDNIDISTNRTYNNNQRNLSGPVRAGIRVDADQETNYTVVKNNLSYSTDSLQFGLSFIGTSNIKYLIAENNILYNNNVNMSISGSPDSTAIIRNNTGYVTENAGTATIASGATTVDVTHGLAITPNANKILLTPTNSLGNSSKFWISNIGATTFRINVNADPGATTATFIWRIV